MRLIVAEKPSVGRDIAGALGGGRKGKGSVEGDGWTVTWALGHLAERAPPEGCRGRARRRWGAGGGGAGRGRPPSRATVGRLRGRSATSRSSPRPTPTARCTRGGGWRRCPSCLRGSREGGPTRPHGRS